MKKNQEKTVKILAKQVVQLRNQREKMIGMMFEQSDQIQKRTIALGKELAAIKEERVEAEKELQRFHAKRAPSTGPQLPGTEEAAKAAEVAAKAREAKKLVAGIAS